MRDFQHAHRDEWNKKQREDHARLRASEWRPAGWNEKPEIYRLIGGLLLLAAEPLSNADVWMILDTLKLPCTYGPSWTDAGNQRQCFKLLNRIRKWVRRPGKKGLSIPTNDAA